MTPKLNEFICGCIKIKVVAGDVCYDNVGLCDVYSEDDGSF